MIEALLLSFCDGITYVKSNVSSAAIAFSKKKMKLHPLLSGYNSRNKYISSLQHAADMGIELNKAEIALQYNLGYVQDKDLEIK